MGKIVRNGIEFSSTSDTADNINYNNSKSGLSAVTAQEAIDEVNENVSTLNSNLGNLVSDIYVGEDGKLHKVVGGADSVLPFSAGFTEAVGFYFNAGVEYPYYIDLVNYRFVEGNKNTGVSGELISVFHSSDSYKYRALKDCEVMTFEPHPKSFSGVVKYSAGDSIMILGYDGLHKSHTFHIVFAREI